MQKELEQEFIEERNDVCELYRKGMIIECEYCHRISCLYNEYGLKIGIIVLSQLPQYNPN